MTRSHSVALQCGHDGGVVEVLVGVRDSAGPSRHGSRINRATTKELWK
jgi:hypothetical protein